MRHLIGLALLCGLTFLAGLGRAAITEADEAYYAEASREMVERGDWVTPHYNYEPRFQKPILYYWLVAAAYEAAGVSAGAARLPAALAGLALAFVAYGIARRMYDERAAWLAGAIVATSFGYFAMARQALPDLPLALFVTLATWGLVEALLRGDPNLERTARTSSGRRGWLLASAAAMGLAFLTKGPIGLVLPFIVVGPLLLLEERRGLLHPFQWFRARIGVLNAVLALALLLAIVVPWYALMVRAHGTWYLQHFFIGENVDRFATDRYNEPRGIWFYAPIAIGGLLPWSAFLLICLGPLASIVRRRRRLSVNELRLLVWTVAPLLFYTASIGKQPRYILPLLPPLAVLLGRAIAARVAGHRGTALLRVAVGAAGITLVAVAAGVLRMDPVLSQVGHTGLVPAAVVIGCAGLAILGLAIAGALQLVPVGVPVAFGITLAALHYTVFSSPNQEAVETLASAVLETRHASEPIAAFRAFDRNLIFYTGIRQEPVFNEAGVIDLLRSPGRVLCVLQEQQSREIEAQMGVPLVRLLTIHYFDPAHLRLDVLLDPARAIDRAVLITNRP